MSTLMVDCFTVSQCFTFIFDLAWDDENDDPKFIFMSDKLKPPSEEQDFDQHDRPSR